MEQRRRFRELLKRPGPIVAPGVYDCLTALMVEQAGFEAVSITGAGGCSELAEMGFKLITFSGSVQRVAVRAVQDFLASFKASGSVADYFPSKMVALHDRSKILGLSRYYELEKRFLSGE